ncbi:Fe-S cluster assembly ATPase SufC [Corynebacterium casei]|uniref:Fe-S cluster assembly ATPase SufC n=1 Tax=Corynebacterium casei TaxID=160386 RepID=UPI003FD2E2CD
MSTLEIKNLHAQVLPNEEGAEPKPILKGVNLTIKSGETHAIMGPNGSGKSTLSYVIAGHPRYEVTEGEVLLDGENILDLEVDERARAGVFLAMQYPTEVAGVKMSQFMRSAVSAVRGEAPKLREWNKELTDARERLHIDKSFIARSVNEGFSGGEKKRHEVMQLDLLKPKFAVMDETDSGLDVDALRIVSDGINAYQEETNGGILMITHYQRILNYIVPDFVHVFADGQIIKTGGSELASELEKTGYEQFQ